MNVGEDKTSSDDMHASRWFQNIGLWPVNTQFLTKFVKFLTSSASSENKFCHLFTCCMKNDFLLLFLSFHLSQFHCTSPC